MLKLRYLINETHTELSIDILEKKQQIEEKTNFDIITRNYGVVDYYLSLASLQNTKSITML
jgi:hypothetical protein